MARVEHDNYPTPSWVTARLLDAIGGLGKSPGRRLVGLEPSAGDGALIRAVSLYRERHGLKQVHWHAIELRKECRPILETFSVVKQIDTGSDFLKMSRGHHGHYNYDFVMMNPPLSHGLQFVKKALTWAPLVIALLPIGFVQAKDRCEFLHDFAPDVYVLPERPAFTGSGNDRTGVAWFVWSRLRRRAGTFSVLSFTAKDVRTGLCEDLALMPRSTRSSKFIQERAEPINPEAEPRPEIYVEGVS